MKIKSLIKKFHDFLPKEEKYTKEEYIVFEALINRLDTNLDVPMIVMGSLLNKQIREDVIAYTKTLKEGENTEMMHDILNKMSKIKDKKYKIA